LKRSYLSVLAVVPALAAVLAVSLQSDFNSSRAYDDLRNVVAFGPRPAGSPALESTRAYMRKQLQQAGVKVTDQSFVASTPIGPVKMTNLIATIPGARPEKLVFGGHYDTKLFRRFTFVGANDAGSSTAFLLELARVLKARKNPLTMEIVFFDGEEAIREEWAGTDNTYGSRHYVEVAKKAGTLGQIGAMVLVDMIGARNLLLDRESNSTEWLRETLWQSGRKLGLQDHFGQTLVPIEDDHLPFLEAGVQAVDLIDLNNYPEWHTPDDTLDKVSARSLQIVGDVLLDALPTIEAHVVKGLGARGRIKD
jgi:glutaminyl-peptide cyclotransferase